MVRLGQGSGWRMGKLWCFRSHRPVFRFVVNEFRDVPAGGIAVAQDAMFDAGFVN